MDYLAVICIMLICVLANHLGLIAAAEKVTHVQLYVINCCKCFTFWFTVIYLIVTGQNVIQALAVSFCAAYLAVWTELLCGIIDKKYDNVFKANFGNTENNAGSEDKTGAENGMSQL